MMMLYEEGKLRLDDPAGQLPARVQGPGGHRHVQRERRARTRRGRRRGEITIRQLLAHTSGLGYPFTSPTVLAIQAKTGSDPRDLPLLFDPGTKWHYSPGHRCSRRHRREAVRRVDRGRGTRQESFVRWGWSTRPTHPPADKAGRLATIHARESSGLVEKPNLPTYVPDVRGDGGLVSTARTTRRSCRCC